MIETIVKSVVEADGKSGYFFVQLRVKGSVACNRSFAWMEGHTSKSEAKKIALNFCDGVAVGMEAMQMAVHTATTFLDARTELVMTQDEVRA